MKRYIVKIYETHINTVVVEAEDCEEAKQKARIGDVFDSVDLEFVDNATNNGDDGILSCVEGVE